MKVKDCPQCDGCPLRQKFPERNLIPSKLGTSLRLVVAEAGGELEEQLEEPLVGGSGKRFDALCRTAGLKRDALTLANTLSCRPPNNIYPTDPLGRSYMTLTEANATVAHCYKNHLRPLLLSRPWDRIDILGDKALFVLTGEHGILERRGYRIDVDTDKIDARFL